MTEYAVMPLTDYVNSCDKIREKTNKTEKIKSGEVTEKINEVYEVGYEQGRKAEYDAFWEAIQNNGQRTNYMYAFAQWNAEYIRPKYKVVPTESVKNIFFKSYGVKKIESQYFDLSQVPRGTSDSASMAFSFYGCNELVEIEDIGLSPSYNYAYAFEARSLRKIAKITVDAETKMQNAFDYCYALEDITFGGEIGDSMNLKWSTKLTRASIESIINHLSDSTTGKTLTLSKTAVLNAFELSEVMEGRLVGTYIAEWLSLIASKQNWTITLV
jgi:hypothetical protein